MPSINTNGKRSLGTCNSKTSRMITSIHNAVRKHKSFLVRGSSLEILYTDSGPRAP